jgi:putative transposase
MPWKNENMNDVRKEFVRKALSEGANLSALCREYHVTRKTGRAWRERAKHQGIDFLAEKSRRPAKSPNQLNEDVICRVISLKLAHPFWGPKKFCNQRFHEAGEAPSISSCHRILNKVGLVERKKKRVKQNPRIILAAAKPLEPNDVWTVDFKGWWHLANGERSEPLTVRDAFSRFVLAASLLKNARTEALKKEFSRLFYLYGLPKVIKSDNGTPFASVNGVMGLSQLSAWWVSLGIVLERSRPAHPQDNSAHERLHKDIEAQVASKTQRNAKTQQVALDLWREEFNHQRPHEMLAERCPAEVYRKSQRKFSADQTVLDYGTGFFSRKVDTGGGLKWNGCRIFISQAVAGWNVGLRVLAHERLEVWLNYLLLGSIDLKTNRFVSAPSRSAKTVRLAA